MKRSYCFFLLPILVASAGCPSSDNHVGSLGKDAGAVDGPGQVASDGPAQPADVAGVGQDAGQKPPAADGPNSASTCVTDSDCPSGLSCGYALADRCAAKGLCLQSNSQGAAVGPDYMCGCDGQAILPIVINSSTVLYVSAPYSGQAGPCMGMPDAGVPDAGPAGSGLGCSCSVLAGAAAAQAVFNNQALECASSICLKPADQLGGVDTGPFCTSGCSTDSDCVGQTRDPNDPSDKRCAGGYTCTVPFVVGPLACKKLCSCNDFFKTPPPPACSSDPNADEGAIYSVLLGNTGGKLPIIAEQTRTDADGVSDTAQTVASATSRMTGVDPATTSNFLSQNATAQSVDLLSLGTSYALLSQTDPIWNDPNFWTTLRTLYPNALVIPQGVVGYETFSRVGFNANMSQALVYMGTYAEMITGTYVSFLEQGYYYLMKKVNGFWTIDQKVLVWTS